MQPKKLMTAAAIIVGLLLLVVAVLYFTQPASALPSFLPGHEEGVTRHHMTHGILAVALALVCFVAARFFYGPTANTPVS